MLFAEFDASMRKGAPVQSGLGKPRGMKQRRASTAAPHEAESKQKLLCNVIAQAAKFEGKLEEVTANTDFLRAGLDERGGVTEKCAPQQNRLL